LETQFYRLRQAKVKSVVLSVFHQSSRIRAALKSLNRFGLKVEVKREPKPLGTGGAIAYAWPDRRKPCLVLNGDVLSDFEIGPLAEAHLKHDAWATLWSIEVEETSAFGVLELDLHGAIRRFVEKPRPGESSSRWINAGLYALSPQLLQTIPRGRMVSVERETFPELLGPGRGARAFKARVSPYWNDIGTPQAYLRANLDVLDGKLALGRLWKGLKGEAVLGRGCTVAKGAVVRRSVLLEGCRVGAGAEVEGAILGRNCWIGPSAKVREGAVLGRGSRISEGSHA
jgi:mannose-1-phosphate guanylyltransferase